MWCFYCNFKQTHQMNLVLLLLKLEQLFVCWKSVINSRAVWDIWLKSNYNVNKTVLQIILWHKWISKRVFQENKARQIFWKTNISFPLIRTRTCAYQGARNVRFFGKFGVLWFLETPVLRFSLLPYYRRISNTLIYCHSALIIFGLVSVWSPITRDKGPASLNFAG